MLLSSTTYLEDQVLGEPAPVDLGEWLHAGLLVHEGQQQRQDFQDETCEEEAAVSNTFQPEA